MSGLTAEIHLVRLPRGKCHVCGQRRIRYVLTLEWPTGPALTTTPTGGLCAVCCGIRDAEPEGAVYKPLLNFFPSPPVSVPEPEVRFYASEPLPGLDPVYPAPVDQDGTDPGGAAHPDIDGGGGDGAPHAAAAADGGAAADVDPALGDA